MIALAFEIVGEIGKLISSGIEASQEQLAEAKAHFMAGVDVLRGVRKVAEGNIDARHGHAHDVLDPK